MNAEAVPKAVREGSADSAGIMGRNAIAVLRLDEGP